MRCTFDYKKLSNEHIETVFYLDEIASADWKEKSITCLGHIVTRKEKDSFTLLIRQIASYLFTPQEISHPENKYFVGSYAMQSAKLAIEDKLSRLDAPLPKDLLERLEKNFNKLVRKNNYDENFQLTLTKVQPVEETRVELEVSNDKQEIQEVSDTPVEQKEDSCELSAQETEISTELQLPVNDQTEILKDN